MIGRLTKEYDFHPYSVMIWPLPPFLHTSQSRGHVDVIRLSFHTFYGRIHHGAGRPYPTLRTLSNTITSLLSRWLELSPTQPLTDWTRTLAWPLASSPTPPLPPPPLQRIHLTT